MMKLLTTLLMMPTILAATGQEVKTPAAPTAISVCREDYHTDQNPGAPTRYVLMPLAAYQSDKWFSEDFFSMMISDDASERVDYAETFRPEQDSFLDTLLNQTFYSVSNLQVQFQAEKKTTAYLVNCPQLGLQGVLSGKPMKNTDEDKYVAMTNMPEILGSLQSGNLTGEDEQLLAERMLKHMRTLIKLIAEKFHRADGSPPFNPELYQPPIFEKVIRCSLPSGWEVLWVQAFLPYPRELSPVHTECPDESAWSGHYYAIVDPKTKSKERILWDYPSRPCNTYNDFEYNLLGICDADDNNKPEFIISEGGYEYQAFKLVRAEKGKLVVISSVSGAL